MRALLAARKLAAVEAFRCRDEPARHLCAASGCKVGPTTPRRFAARIRELVFGQATLEVIAEALLAVHAVLLENDLYSRSGFVRWRATTSECGC